MGVLADSVAPDVAMPMVAADDIAAVAAKALIERDWSGIAVQELLGPRDLSQVEVARILGERIGQPDLPYVSRTLPGSWPAPTRLYFPVTNLIRQTNYIFKTPWSALHQRAGCHAPWLRVQCTSNPRCFSAQPCTAAACAGPGDVE
jgi:hypothetical protein